METEANNEVAEDSNTPGPPSDEEVTDAVVSPEEIQLRTEQLKIFDLFGTIDFD